MRRGVSRTLQHTHNAENLYMTRPLHIILLMLTLLLTVCIGADMASGTSVAEAAGVPANAAKSNDNGSLRSWDFSPNGDESIVEPDMCDIYRICNTKPVRLLSPSWFKQQRTSCKALHTLKTLLSTSAYRYKPFTQTMPVAGCVSTGGIAVLLRHILR